MKSLIKWRKAKKSNRGLYLQDTELSQTEFQPGMNFKYVVDPKNRKVIILPSQDSQKNTVSKRKTKTGFKPVIDIRSKEALSVFDDCDYLQIQIFGEEIVIEVFENTTNENVRNGQKSKTQKSIGQVSDIRQFKKVRQKAVLRLSKKELQQAVGESVSYQQFNIFDFLDTKESTGTNISYIQHALKNVKIPLQVVSLFSGAGLFDYAFKEMGYETIFALEKDSEIAKTYRHNIGEIEVADITKYDKNKLPYAPILIGGSPCKGFSNSNRYSHYLDNPNNLLVREYIECVKKINPYVFVLENVPQLLTAGDGQFVKEIEQELKDFQITKGVISSASFGDFQDRKRTFIIGSRLGEKIELPEGKLSKEQFKTVGEAFKNLSSTIPNQLDFSNPKPITEERIKYVPPGGNVFDIPEEIRPKGQHSDMYKRLEEDKVAVTIVNPRKAMLLHPKENRIISIREACRLFSLPDTFIFKGGLSAMREAIANGIPLKMGKAIAEKVKNAITQFNLRNRLGTVQP